jgi:hypothetical protein
MLDPGGGVGHAPCFDPGVGGGHKLSFDLGISPDPGGGPGY